MPRKVIHLIPYDGIGGVETAARSMAGHSIEGLDFQVDYIYPPASSKRGRYDTFNPWPMLRTVRRILASKSDFLIVSLWRSCIVGLFSKLLCRRLQLVLFLHSPSDGHWLDRLVTRCVAALADQIWADSQETLNLRLPSIHHNKGKVISFVTRRTAPLPIKPVNPVFIFWGRIHPQKGLDRALGVFSAVYKTEPSARFIIIGPDGGDLERIKALVNKLGLTDTVHFPGGIDFNAISQQAGAASFYLQTSSLEGMAMSVVEAMQLGLVPVVTPVGEIGNYCQHDNNAIVVQTDEAIVDEIVAVLHDDARYLTLRKNAIATWAEEPLYADSVLKACMEIVCRRTEDFSALMNNLDQKTVKSFDAEWSRFDQSGMSDNEARKVFGEYFSVFPWHALPSNAVGFDMGCGSGRWARLIAPRVGRLHCIDPTAAIEVARANLSEHANIAFHRASVDDTGLTAGTQDFGYSLGVLHHVPDTGAAIRSCVTLLRPGAPLLLYLYYAFDNRPWWFKALWRVSDWGRQCIYRLPHGLKHRITDLIATLVYWPLTRLSLMMEHFGLPVESVPLSYYRNHSFYTMRTDALDRFGTPLEHRFSRDQIAEMMEAAGLEDVQFSDMAPYWCAVGLKVG